MTCLRMTVMMTVDVDTFDVRGCGELLGQQSVSCHTDLVARFAGCWFNLGVLVTLFDTYPLAATHSRSVLVPQTAFQDPSRPLLVSLGLRHIKLLN